jgi:hypothetical protein
LLTSLLARFKLDAAALLAKKDEYTNFILFGIIEAGIQLPSDAPADLLQAQKLWNELHPSQPEQAATIDNSAVRPSSA